MPTPTLFADLTRAEITRRGPTALAMLPTGATEQHGPHLPVGTDTFAVEAISRAAAARQSEEVDAIVTPTLPFGSSQHHLQFGGTMSVSTATYYALIRDLVDSLITVGFQRVLIVNGHGGNQELVQLVVRDLALEHENVSLGAASYWQMASGELEATNSADRGRTPGHAGHFETSLMMALRPDRIVEPRPVRTSDPSLIGPPDLHPRIRFERSDAWRQFDGFTDSPASATAEFGQTYLEAAITGVAETIRLFHQATSELPLSDSSSAT